MFVRVLSTDLTHGTYSAMLAVNAMAVFITRGVGLGRSDTPAEAAVFSFVNSGEVSLLYKVVEWSI